MVLKNPNEYEKGKTLVYFVRHGDRIHIPEKKDIGFEIPGPGLNNLGKKQAKSIAKDFKKIKKEVDIIYSSDMTRAIETAKEISKVVGKKVRSFNGLEEIKDIAFTRKLHNPLFWKYYRKHKKSIKVLDKILKQNKGKVIIIVAHGRIIAGILGRKLGLSRIKILSLFHHENCAVTLLRFKDTKLDHIYYVNNNGVK